MFFREKYEQLAFFQKLELYLIILIVYFGIYYYFENSMSFDKQMRFDQSSNKLISKKIQQISSNKALELVQQKLIESHIQEDSLTIQGKNLLLEFQSSYNKSFRFLQFLENHFSIEYLNIDAQKSFLKIKVILNIKNIFDIQQSKFINGKLGNPFYFKSTRQNKIEKIKTDNFIVPQIQIDAILDNEILIDGVWYGLNDSIKDNKIIKIEQERVIFKNLLHKKKFIIKMK